MNENILNFSTRNVNCIKWKQNNKGVVNDSIDKT